MNHWLLQVNPRVWDIDRFFADGRELDSFMVSNFLDAISARDDFVLWQAGKDSGVIGVGRVLGPPVEALSDELDDYWLRDTASLAWSIPIEVTALFREDPLSRQVFMDDPVLSDATIIRAPQSANPFRLTDEQWDRIQGLMDIEIIETTPWDLNPGDRIKRTELHDRFGGRTQSGITTSTSSPNILVFTDPATGEQYGYFDEWGTDGCFYYTGEGQSGDQDPDRGGNKALRQARRHRRAIRVFEGTAGTVTYLGRFEVDAQAPFVWATAPSKNNGPLRKVVRFRLRPIDAPGNLSNLGRQVGQEYRERDAEVQVRFPIARVPTDPDAYGRGLRSHIRTEKALARIARESGLRPLTPTIEDPPFDVAWETADGTLVVIEVKSTTESNETKQLRTGVGQILDYANSLESRGFSVYKVLCTTTPVRDRRWTDIASGAGIHLIDFRQRHALPGLTTI